MDNDSFLEKIIRLCEHLSDTGIEHSLADDIYSEAIKRRKTRDAVKARKQQPRKRPRGVNNG